LIARVLFVCLLLPSALFAQGRELPDFTDLAERQGPTVVNISTTQVRERRASPQIPNLEEDDPLYDFFRRFIRVRRVPADRARAISRAVRSARASSSAPTATFSPTRTSSILPMRSPFA